MGCNDTHDPLLDKEQAAKFLRVNKGAFNAIASRYKIDTIIKNKKAYYRRSTLKKHRDRNLNAK